MISNFRGMKMKNKIIMTTT